MHTHEVLVPKCFYMRVCMHHFCAMLSVKYQCVLPAKKDLEIPESLQEPQQLCYHVSPSDPLWMSDDLSALNWESSPPQSQTFCNLSPSCWMASCFHLTGLFLCLISQHAMYNCSPPLFLLSFNTHKKTHPTNIPIW